MEQQQQHSSSANSNNNNNGTSSHMNSGSRQSSTRWTPTTDQIRILKDLYYNNGVRSPSAEQIQRISARLRQYGKIEGKNVFYWFQNHKARERQKKRFTSDSTTTTNVNNLPLPTMHRGSTINNNNNAPNCWNKPTEDITTTTTFHSNKYYSNNMPSSTGIASSSSSSAGMVGVGQMGNYGCGSVPMEKSFRECTISAGGGSSVGGAINHNLGWVGVDPYSSTYTAFFDKIRPEIETLEQEQGDDNNDDEEIDDVTEIETLPLFPMHGEDIHDYCSLRSNNSSSSSFNYDHHHHGFNNGGSRASLELSLNSYGRKSPDYA
ncbi:hypothetical protein HN51_006972 [Arachis hypogaea]|uniref:Protein WUSCHEL n=1 Tax=Arachis duranensis TaxID=130453 RepID=A0A6P4D900_ARADU|nr:protein WUSCHEL [Arachis duranensis]XP_025703311.1 protein WUSCHEL-like [Arachis hypogaea]QHO41025.1 Protein WUSCHEL [Arachis hypogaea]